MEMALATFLRLAARRLKTSRAVLAGQCKASGHRRSLERWGPVLTDAKKRLADALDLQAPPPPVHGEEGLVPAEVAGLALRRVRAQVADGWMEGGGSARRSRRRPRPGTCASTVERRMSECGEELRRELGACNGPRRRRSA